MSDRIERRIADKDPVDVLTPEVFALLKLCGGLRSTDVQGGRPRGQGRASERPLGDERRDETQQRGSVVPPDLS
jgi:hypothetical protein